ncbi:MAG TPA: hypothetical protein DCM08_05775 [Microscillaceae bacterium]|nr:hypothetical protein [Microscillaceae bacterium]
MIKSRLFAKFKLSKHTTDSLYRHPSIPTSMKILSNRILLTLGLWLLVCWQGPLWAQPDRMAALQAQYGSYDPHRVVFKLKPATDQAQTLSQPACLAEIRYEKIQAVAWRETQDIFQLQLASEIDVETTLAQLRADARVEYAEPYYYFFPMDLPQTSANPLLTPNDPSVGSQYYLTKLNALQAWDIQTGSASFLIGITDSGFDLTHPDLINNFSGGFNVADGNMTLGGDQHGSQVTGVASAQANNSVGIAGVGYACRFMPVKAASGSSPVISQGLEAVVYAAQNGCKVINMSWGRQGNPSLYEMELLRYLVDVYDVVLVAAAGNSGSTGYFYPASYKGIVCSVASLNATNDDKVGFSTYNDRVDVAAYGDQALTTNPGGTYANASGTSFAAPQVAAAAALVRLQFPSLKASQVIARLKATSDPVLAHTNYLGQMGTGRMNMQAALQATPLKFIAINQAWLGLQPGTSNRQLLCAMRNELDALSNLTITVTSSNPQVVVVKNQSAIGAVATYTDFTNQADPIVLSVNPSLPANTLVSFQVTFSDGVFSSTQTVALPISPAPSYLTLQTNQVAFTAADNGLATLFNNTDQVGFRYKNNTLLSTAGLLIGTNATRISNALYVDNATTDQSFTNTSILKFDPASTAQNLQAGSTFTDVPGNPNRVGVEVQQRYYALSDPALSGVVIAEYKVKNISGSALSNVFAGVFADWNVQNAATNRADWDGTRNLGYVFQTQAGGLYAGLRLLSDQTPAYYAIDNDGSNGSMQINNNFSSAEKFQLISSGLSRTQAGMSGAGNDVAHAIGVNLGTLQNGQTVIFSVAFLAADNLAALQNSAQAAKTQFNTLKTGPLPQAQTLNVCLDANYVLRPLGGKLFNFYNRLPVSLASAINVVGSTLVPAEFINLGNFQTNQTIYVTNADSLYQSAPVAIQLQVAQHQAGFTMSTDTLNLAASNTLSLQSTSADAVAWQWDLGNGTTSTLANPTATFTQAGTYSITLTSTGTNGCTNSVTKSLQVINRALPVTNLADPIDKGSFRVYPNPAQGSCHVQLAEPPLGTATILLWDAQGNLLQQWTTTEQTTLLNLLPRWAGGLYFVEVRQGAHRSMEKLFIHP